MKVRYAVKAGRMSASDLAVVGLVIGLWLAARGRDLPAVGEAREEEHVVGQDDACVLLVDVDRESVRGSRKVEPGEGLDAGCPRALLEILPSLLGQQGARLLGCAGDLPGERARSRVGLLRPRTRAPGQGQGPERGRCEGQR